MAPKRGNIRRGELMRYLTPALILTAVTLAGCSRFGSDSGLNPFGWFRGSATQPTSLEPKTGWNATSDLRSPMAQVLSARFEPLNEGRLLVVDAIAPTTGWWEVGLITQVSMPEGQLRPDENGVLRLAVVGNPPRPDSKDATRPSDPARDKISVALPISSVQLSRIREIVIQAQNNAISIRR